VDCGGRDGFAWRACACHVDGSRCRTHSRVQYGVYKWALNEIAGFDPVYWKAGDDVDVCWRLQQRGYRLDSVRLDSFGTTGAPRSKRISNSNAATAKPRALLVRKHPEYFNSLGASIWHGRIYTSAKIGVVTRKPMIYHGVFGSGFFNRFIARNRRWP